MLGVYDSGVGGITVYNEISSLLPELDIIYLADQAILPLGEKSVSDIRLRLTKACQILFEKGCDIVILACNTATVNAIRDLQSQWLPKYFPNKQILGVSKPFTEFIADNFLFQKNIQGLILSTPATHQSGFYINELSLLGFTNFVSQPCTGLAQSIEKQNDIQTYDLLKKYILQNSKSQAIFLACTHYPIVTDIIDQLVVDFSLKMTVVDHTSYIAQRVRWYLSKHTEFKVLQQGYRLWLCSGDIQTFTKQVKNIFGLEIAPEFVSF